ncbi:chemotaxis protein CheW [Sphaerotilus sp.]|uniref:chemotaxis protein CheA n=1 Tax=Sphaerotilus sp. TaxID=2093942 RepID=UPI00286DC1C2|nr:chemotaxis protein CheW [Sphaerotilus sp.]
MTDSTQDHRDPNRSSDGGLDLQQFHQTFFEEAAENLQRMEQLLLALDPAAVDDETLNAIFRVAHSIKGGAATFGFTEVAELSHEMETLLDRLRRHELSPTPPMVDVLLRGGDALWAQLSFRQGQAPETPPTEPLVADIRQLARLSSSPAAALARASSADAPAAAAAPIKSLVGQRELEVRIGPLDHPGAANHLHELFEEIPGLGEMRPLDFGEAVDGMRRFSVTTSCTDSELLDLFSFHVDRAQVHLSVLGLGYGFHEGNPGAPSQAAVKATTAAQAAPAASAVAAPAAPRPGGGGAGAAVDATTLRVSVDKVDQLINLVGELVITQAMLIQSSRALDPVAHQALLSSISLVERNSRDLQDAVMSIRMIPMSAVFSRFPRMLRDLSSKLGKQVELVTIGEATELDKGLVEKITDPLTHLVRNSCDHGIELPQVRTQSGKTAHGTITLSAWHQGGSVVIEVRDDGKGLSREKLLSKARERGLAAPDSLTDTQVWNLIFEPGFSTADVVTDVSGRGVGMDVVKKNITGLGGRVEIDSAPGCGMSVKVRLPLTLAIMDGMSVAVRDEVYILPMASVVESDLVGPDSIRSLGGGGRVAKVRDDYLPVVDLAELLGSPRTEGQAAPGIMVIVESEGLRAALLVDELVGQQQVVVKNLETHFRRIPDVSGATILGNGKVALILDVGTLVSRR